MTSSFTFITTKRLQEKIDIYFVKIALKLLLNISQKIPSKDSYFLQFFEAKKIHVKDCRAFYTPLSQWPGENLLASGDKMKESNANGDGKSLVLNEWGFQILLFTVQKSSGDSQNFSVFFLVGMRVQCIFPMGMEFQGIFLTGAHRGRILDHFFQWGGVPTESVTQGCLI